MPAKLTVTSKAVTKETRQQSRVFRECDHAVADIAGWQHLQFVAETPGTAAIIGNGDDGREAFDPDRLLAFTNESFEPGEKCRQSRAAADGYDVLTTCVCSLLQMKAPGEGKPLGIKSYLNLTGIGVKRIQFVPFVAKLGGLAKDQPIEVGIVAQWIQVVIVLCTHSQIGLQVKCFL